ncbi:MAG: hypothetical protein ACYC11_00315 [Bellilinea sp.]
MERVTRLVPDVPDLRLYRQPVLSIRPGIFLERKNRESILRVQA